MSLVGWACNCHSGGVVVRSATSGIDVASYCPARFAAGPPAPAAKVRDATEIRSRPPILRAVPLPPNVVPPPDVPRLTHRLGKLGIEHRCTYALAWWSIAEPIDAPPPAPPDADRIEADNRDVEDVEITLPTGETIRRRPGTRTTRDVPVLLESVALRVPAVGVQVWWRIGAPELKRGVPTGRPRPWEPNAGWLVRQRTRDAGPGWSTTRGFVTPTKGTGITEFKARLKELEGK